jgi:hypothetical protein
VKLRHQKITSELVQKYQALKPRRICFESVHQKALKVSNDSKYAGTFNVPFMEGIDKLFPFDLFRRRASENQPETFWRSIKEQAEYDKIEKWIKNHKSIVFLRSPLEICAALSSHFASDLARTLVGQLEYEAKHQKNTAKIVPLLGILESGLKLLEPAISIDVICAVPPRRGKDYDLPSQLANSLATKRQHLI